MEQYCSRDGYDSDKSRTEISKKLTYLKNKLISKNVHTNSVHFVIVEISIYFVDSGYALSKELLLYLNKINDRL
jgi:hypothetical protein